MLLAISVWTRIFSNKSSVFQKMRLYFLGMNSRFCSLSIRTLEKSRYSVSLTKGTWNKSHRIHVWYIYLHLPYILAKCRWIYHTWILWECFNSIFSITNLSILCRRDLSLTQLHHLSLKNPIGLTFSQSFFGKLPQKNANPHHSISLQSVMVLDCK